MGSKGDKAITAKKSRALCTAIGLYPTLASSIFFSVKSETFYFSSMSLATAFDCYNTSIPFSSSRILSALFRT